MRVHPARAAPLLQPDDRIAPHQLWSLLSVGQQQHVRQVLISVAQQLMAHRPIQPRTEETTHAPRSQSEPSKDPRRNRRGFEGRWALRRHCPLRLHLPMKGSRLLCWGNLSPKPPNTDAIPPHRKQWGILA